MIYEDFEKIDSGIFSIKSYLKRILSGTFIYLCLHSKIKL